jgi:endonuclease/exonuclease/phosphatase (EEP) superfamily protein YafD
VRERQQPGGALQGRLVGPQVGGALHEQRIGGAVAQPYGTCDAERAGRGDAVVILGYLVLRLISGEQLDAVALGNSLMPAILIPSVFLLVLMIAARRRVVAGLLVPAVAVFAVGYGVRYIPGSLRASAAPSGVLSMTILTYNIASKRDDFERMITIIRETDADVVALQELLTPAAEAVDSALRDTYP